MPLAVAGNRPGCCRLTKSNHLCSIFRGIYKYVYIYLHYTYINCIAKPTSAAWQRSERNRCRLPFGVCRNVPQRPQIAYKWSNLHLKLATAKPSKSYFQLGIAYFYRTYRFSQIWQRQTHKSVRFVQQELDLIEFRFCWSGTVILHIRHVCAQSATQLKLFDSCFYLFVHSHLTVKSDPGDGVLFNANKLKAFHHVYNNNGKWIDKAEIISICLFVADNKNISSSNCSCSWEKL